MLWSTWLTDYICKSSDAADTRYGGVSHRYCSGCCLDWMKGNKYVEWQMVTDYICKSYNAANTRSGGLSHQYCSGCCLDWIKGNEYVEWQMVRSGFEVL